MSRIAEKIAWYIYYVKCEESRECVKRTIEKLKNDPKAKRDLFWHAVALVWLENLKKYDIRRGRRVKIVEGAGER